MTTDHIETDLSDHDVELLSALLRDQLSPLTFDAELARRRRPAWAVPAGAGAAVAAAAAVVGAVVLGSGGAVAPAWAAEPSTASAALVSAATSQCLDFVRGTGKVPAGTALHALAFDSRGTSTMVVVEGVTTTVDPSGSPASGTPLGTAVSFACFAHTDPSGALVPDGASGGLSGDGAMPVDTLSGTVTPTSSIVYGYGRLAPGAVTVEVSAPGLPTATASITGDHYAIWWPHHAQGTLTERDASGAVVKQLATPDLDAPTKP